MENYNPTSQKSTYSLEKEKKSINKTSYRGFASIDQEMGREIALEFFHPSKKTICSQKGFLFGKR